MDNCISIILVFHSSFSVYSSVMVPGDGGKLEMFCCQFKVSVLIFIISVFQDSLLLPQDIFLPPTSSTVGLVLSFRRENRWHIFEKPDLLVKSTKAFMTHSCGMGHEGYAIISVLPVWHTITRKQRCWVLTLLFFPLPTLQIVAGPVIQKGCGCCLNTKL